MPSTPRASKNNILNLLDFELPPAPTPRSVPTITVREMESLKSKFSSEISSLRATLSGREAEVEALKRAVSDAERRVAEAMEASREERSKRECVEKEKEQWERRGRDFEEILRKVKEEVLVSEKEKTVLMARIEEADDRARDAEARATEAEARAIEAATKIVDTGITSAEGHEGPLFTAEQVQKQIDENEDGIRRGDRPRLLIKEPSDPATSPTLEHSMTARNGRLEGIYQNVRVHKLS